MIGLKINNFRKYILDHDLRNVYLDLFIRLAFNFYLFTLITIRVESNIFSMYAFCILFSSLIVQIINGSTENLINKSLVLNVNFLNYYFLKLIIFILLNFPFILLFKSNDFIISSVLLSFISLSLEHLDIKLRYFYSYKVYAFKVLLQFFFIFFKIKSAKIGDIHGILYYSILEAFIMVLISCFFVVKLRKGENDILIFFFKKEKEAIFKYTISSFFIFLFFKLDQFFIYFKFNPHFFSGYFIASRFNEILNSLVSIWARYSIPKLFKEDSIKVFRKILLSNILVHLLFSLFGLVGVLLYVLYLNPSYSKVLEIYLILCLSGFFLVFGQVRGVYFIKNNYFLPDIINAITGILFFLLSVIILGYCFESYFVIPFSYFLGFMVSGFLTTFMYKLGRKFISELIER